MARNKPTIHEIEEALRRRVSAGSGRTELPTEMTLMAEFNVSRYAIRRALAALVADGLIERRRGRGTHIVDPQSRRASWSVESIEDMIGERLKGETRTISSRMVAAGAFRRAARSFRVDRAQQLFQIQRVTSSGDTPFSLTSIFLPSEIGASLTSLDLSRPSILLMLEDRFSLFVHKVRQTTSASVCSASESRHLEMKTGAPVLRAERIYFDRSNIALVYVDAVHNAEHFELTMTLYRGNSARNK